MTDAAPRSLYVSRKLLNADALVKWAKSQGFETTVPAERCTSRCSIRASRSTGWRWASRGTRTKRASLRVPPGRRAHARRFGNLKDAVVLLFNSSSLCWRHEDMISKGASSDYDDYQPHVTITYDAPAGFDLSKVEPYRGELIFGPEIFAEI
jgi:hypothetical protein